MRSAPLSKATLSPDALGGSRGTALTPEEKLSGDMLMFSTGLMVFASVLWLAIYWSMGQRFSTMVPLVFQLLSAGNMFLYYRSRKIEVFCLLQLSLFLFTPFILQWSIGNFVNASGVSLWALLAPVGAIVVMGTKESVPWFIAYLFMQTMSGMFDYVLEWDPRKIDPQTVAVFFALNFISISAMVYLLLWYFSREKAKLAAQVDQQKRSIEMERELSDRLLLNILPAPIAERLKRQETNIADGYPDVTVMFADIVNFTHLSEEMSPNETVHLLNDIFSEFDSLAERRGLEKIKTIGDAYMVASGLSNKGDMYVDATIELAQEMQRYVGKRIAPNGESLRLRIGIATGPVVAGVIGKRKFSYDLWGDTVNVASRLTNEAQPGQICVDTTTYRRLHNRFDFSEGSQIPVKGKGVLQVFSLIGRIES
ncbi:MAG: adenylate/guanylate cyclase domain-containing protein [Betaproteobacteria bacterium]|nr:adenylate/guanylate cyclase domain-containing protein [Betaproteobacteria bacterium]